MSYRPKIKTNATGTITDLPLDAETVKGGTLHKTLSASDDTNFSTDKAVADYIDSKGFGPGTVKKVNNTSPDSNGNVTITIPQGTVTSVSAGTGLSISGTSTVNPTVNVASGYKLPTTTEWGNKQDTKPDGTNALIESSTNKISTKYIPDAILGQLLFGGTVNVNTAVATLSTNAKSKLGTTSNTITLTNNTAAITGYAANEGIYYVVQTAGTFAGISYSVGDWLLSTGTAWGKVDNTDEVTSVNGRVGAVSVMEAPTVSIDSSSTAGTLSPSDLAIVQNDRNTIIKTTAGEYFYLNSSNGTSNYYFSLSLFANAKTATGGNPVTDIKKTRLAISLSNGTWDIGGQLIATVYTVDQLQKMSQSEFDDATSSSTPTGMNPIVDLIYPIGSIYMSVNSTSPATLFGGTWVALKDRFLIGAGSSYAGGATGGSTSHAHHLSPDKVVAQICVDGSSPAGLRANASVPNVTSWQSGFKIGGSSFTSETANRTYGTGVEGYADSSNNMPPYLVVYMWKRTT